MTSIGIAFLLFLLLVWCAGYDAGVSKEGGDLSPGVIVPIGCVGGVVILLIKLVVLGIGVDK